MRSADQMRCWPSNRCKYGMQNDLRRWLRLVESSAPDTSSRHLRAILAVGIHNTGELGELETALTLWGEGSTREAQPLLLSLGPVAARYATVDRAMLYRGFLPSDQQWEQLRVHRQFTIETSPNAPLASWSLSKAKVTQFMVGWERAWVMIGKPTADLDVFINCVAFHRLAKPRQHMDVQQEVIVKMPPVMTVKRAELAVHRS